jgi:hypothetical protein
MLRRIYGALFPGAIVVALTVTALVRAPESAILDATRTYGPVVFGAGIALAWVFHPSQVVRQKFTKALVNLRDALQ